MATFLVFYYNFMLKKKQKQKINFSARIIQISVCEYFSTLPIFSNFLIFSRPHEARKVCFTFTPYVTPGHLTVQTYVQNFTNDQTNE